MTFYLQEIKLTFLCIKIQYKQKPNKRPIKHLLGFMYTAYNIYYRLITAYLLLRVNLDKIMHAR